MRKFAIAAALCLTSSLACAAGDVANGEQKSAACAACHGANGVSASPAFPTLAGQHATYLEAALNQYKNGSRANPIMTGQAANLSKQDIKDLAAYYSQQNGLYTPAYPE